MQMVLNIIVIWPLLCTVHLDFKKRPNDNLISFAREAIFPLVIAIANTG